MIYYEGRDCVYKCFPSATETQVNPYKLDITIPKNPKYNAMPTCMGFVTTGVAIVTGAAFHLEYASNETMLSTIPLLCYPLIHATATLSIMPITTMPNRGSASLIRAKQTNIPPCLDMVLMVLEFLARAP